MLIFLCIYTNNTDSHLVLLRDRCRLTLKSFSPECIKNNV